MELHHWGIVAGFLLVTVEIGIILATILYGDWLRQRVPRTAKAMGVGLKTTSYRVCAGLDTFLVSWFMTGSPWLSTGIVGLELVTKFFLYYAHEWVWHLPGLAKHTSLYKPDLERELK